VQLIATAHGNTLNNLVLNPTLSDLVGGIQTVTLGDDEARRRRTQKSVLERKSPPTFEVVVEIQAWDRVAVHDNVAGVVDAMLRGFPLSPEVRSSDRDGGVRVSTESVPTTLFPEGGVVDAAEEQDGPLSAGRRVKVLPFGVSKGRVAQIVQIARMPIDMEDNLDRADVLLTTKQFFRKMPKLLKNAEETGKSIFVLRKNSLPQIREFLMGLSRERGWEDPVTRAVKEVEEATRQVHDGQETVSLTPQIAYIRRLQHQIAEESSLASVSVGREPYRRVTISRK
jgi:hypothetical protein